MNSTRFGTRWWETPGPLRPPTEHFVRGRRCGDDQRDASPKLQASGLLDVAVLGCGPRVAAGAGLGQKRSRTRIIWCCCKNRTPYEPKRHEKRITE
jgi:hypothetical protein